METQQLYNISLIAAFVAGMVALFAPCCISYLLPTYFANVFKERKQIFLMTLVYSLGIFAVMMPIVLGARSLSQFFFKYHDMTYLVGGIFLLIISQVALLGIKLPMPHFSMVRSGQSYDVGSTFILGIFSGITSACCAPVLLGVVTISALSPTIFSSLGVGFSYVLGMVAPLYIASVFIKRGNILSNPIMKKKVAELHLFGHVYPIFVSNIVASIVFFATGALILIFLSAGRLGMPDGSVSRYITETAMVVNNIFVGFRFINIVFALLVGLLLYWYVKSDLNKKEIVEVKDHVTIVVDGGYKPDTISILKGKKTTITFLRTDPSSCLEEVIFPDFKVRKYLPLHQEVDITITPERPGQYSFSCGMNMYHGKLIVR